MKPIKSITFTLFRSMVALLALLAMGWGLTPTAQAQGTEYEVYCGEFRNLDLFAKIAAANTNPGLDTLILAEGCTYTLFVPHNGVNGLPLITDDLIIEGKGATIERSDTTARQFRLMEIGDEAEEVTLKNLTLRNGYVPVPVNLGGAIYTVGSTKLTIDMVRFVENKANYGGGAVYTYGAITVRRSKFEKNQALNGPGGGLYAYGSVTVTNSDFKQNQAFTFGGGIVASQDATVTNSTFYRNNALVESGGGLYVVATLDLRQSYFEGNTAGKWGGGLWLKAVSGARGKIINNLWVRNSASSDHGYAMYLGPGTGGVDVQHNTLVGSNRIGSGIFIYGPGVTVENSIFSGYYIGLHKIYGNAATTSRFNLYYDNQKNHQGIDIVEATYTGSPRFGEAYRLSEGSPAIDKGTNVGVNVDYGGTPRPCGAGYDIGAYEFQFECPAPPPDPGPGGPFTVYLPLVVK